MKNKFFLWIVSALLLVAGCTNDDIVKEQPTPEEGGKITLTASMPGETAQTRVNLAPETGTKNIIITWRVGDQAKFFFKQNSTIVEGALVTLNTDDITLEGKQATFTVGIPDGIDGQNPYTVYMVHGADSKLDGGKILINVASSDFMPIADLHNVPVTGSVVVPGGALVGDIPLQHLGALQCLTFKSISAESFQFSADLLPQTPPWSWFYSMEEYDSQMDVPYLDLINGGVDYTLEEMNTPEKVIITIEPNETIMLAQWVMLEEPDEYYNYIPEIKLILSKPNSWYDYESYNSKPQRSTYLQAGKAYHLYALWDGGELCFTDNTFTPPTLPPPPPSLKGYLMHADGGNNLIGVVYSKNDGNVYYNSTEDGDLYDGITWSGETLLGTGTEARITIDRNDNSHVVFTTTDGRIAYCKHDGTAWSDPVYIESKFGGSCSKPDIDVDINGYAHITYTDYDSACNDILYAENTTNNSFVKTVIFDGSYNSDAQIGNYYDKGSRIAVDEDGNYYIIAFHRHLEQGVNNYNVLISTSAAYSSVGTSPTTNENDHDIYDLESNDYYYYYDDNDIIALYKDNGVNRTASIVVDEYGIASFSSNTKDITTQGIIPHSLSPRNDVAGLSNSNLFVMFNYCPPDMMQEIYDDVTVKSGTIAAIVNKSNASGAYVIYTNNADSRIKMERFYDELPH